MNFWYNKNNLFVYKCNLKFDNNVEGRTKLFFDIQIVHMQLCLCLL